MAGKANAPNWKKIKAEYIRGGISQQKLADKYGVPYGTLHRKALLEKWSELRKEAELKTTQKPTEKIADAQADYLTRMSGKQERAAEMLFEKLLGSIEKYPNGVGTRTVRETVDVRTIETDEGEERKIPLKATFIADLESIARTMATISKLLGIDAASVLDKRRLELQYNPFGSEEPEDDGFLDALSDNCAEAWGIEDVPANINDRDEGGGEE